VVRLNGNVDREIRVHTVWMWLSSGAPACVRLAGG
jgi:hypothetical protein